MTKHSVCGERNTQIP